MTKDKLNILFLPAWYPHKEDSMFGLFVKKHALALLPHANVSVIYVHAHASEKNYEISINEKDGIFEIIVYFNKSNTMLLGKFINIFRMLISYRKALKILKTTKGKTDVNHVHILTRAGIIALILKITQGTPYVITEHWSRYYSFNTTYKGWLRKAATKLVVRKASAMSTVSVSLKNAMNNIGINNPNWHIIPNSIDTSLFTNSNKSSNNNTVRMFHISCFEDKSKNVSGIIKAFEKAIKINPNLELIMIGDGEDYNSIIELSKELNLESKIEFTGVLEGEKLTEKVNSCDFLVMNSNYETFAIVIIESLSMGKAVISTDAGAIPEVLPKEFGIFIKPNDSDALSDAMLKMADEYKNYNSDAMHEYARKHYDTIKVGEILNKFYIDTLS